MSLKLLYALSSSLLLTACIGEGFNVKQSTVPETAPVEPVIEGARPAPVETPEVKAEPLEVTGLKLGDILQKSPAMIQNKFGEPALIRWDGSMQILQYQGDNCVVDVIFYEATEGEGFNATHLRGRNSNGAQSNGIDCLSLIALPVE